MTVLIVLPEQSSLNSPLWTLEQWDRVLGDFFEAVEYEKEHDFDTRVVLKGFAKNGLPVYEKIPDDELTYIEWRCEERKLTCSTF